MFDFMSMYGTYEERKVANFKGLDCEGNNFTLDTCRVTDSKQPYETALMHPFYNDNEWVILESYDTKEESQAGHNKWFNVFVNAEKLPEEISDHIVGGFEEFMSDRIVHIER